MSVEQFVTKIRRKTVEIPAGMFLMGSAQKENEQPIHNVFLNQFSIMPYLVTNEQYAFFLNSRGIIDGEGGSYMYINPFNVQTRVRRTGDQYITLDGYEKHPVTGISWNGAQRFCEWIGGRLPTEAEWERVARGNGEQHIYSWGNHLPNTPKGNYAEQIGDTTPIGQFSANSSGVFDIDGNASEWCLDWYDPHYYKNSPERNPRGPAGGTEKVFRGGNWSYNVSAARVAKRQGAWFRLGKTTLSFRAVFDVQ